MRHSFSLTQVGIHDKWWLSIEVDEGRGAQIGYRYSGLLRKGNRQGILRAHLHIATKKQSLKLHRCFIEFFVVKHEFFDKMSMKLR